MVGALLFGLVAVGAPHEPAPFKPNATTAAFQSTCEEVLYQNPSAQDGEYDLSCGATGIIRVYCFGFGTGSPKEYISLPLNTKTYSRYVTDQGPPASECETTWTKIRINPCTLQIDSLDRTFAVSKGSYTWNDVPFTWLPLGHAGNCYDDADDCNDPTRGVIDLTGTGFEIVSEFEPNGCCPACGAANFSADRAKVDISGGGYCGFMRVKGFNDYSYPQSRWLLQLRVARSPPPPPPPVPECANLAGEYKDTCARCTTNCPPTKIAQVGCNLDITHAGAVWSPAIGAVKKNFVTMSQGFQQTGVWSGTPNNKIRWSNDCVWTRTKL
jgi:hypothetical protein